MENSGASVSILRLGIQLISSNRDTLLVPHHTFKHIHKEMYACRRTTFTDSPFSPHNPPGFFDSLSDTHMLRSSMVGSDTKLMPCHTGCQQISQWITPQPLDVHRAKGHKHGSKRVDEEESEAECEAGNGKAREQLIEDNLNLKEEEGK